MRHGRLLFVLPPRIRQRLGIEAEQFGSDKGTLPNLSLLV
jgi:hypothetical protein